MEQLQSIPTAVEPRDQVRWSLPRWIAFPLKFLIGVLLIQNLLGAIVVMGWVWRLSQRFTLKAWWKRTRATPWTELLSITPDTKLHHSWPNWILGQGTERRLRHRLFGSLWLNFKTGLSAVFNTWVITAPAFVLWIFSWYDGWNNSFNKGYEQAAVGPATGILGVILFIAAMFYLPMAQACHAATGDWRSFYQFRLIWTLIRRSWLQSLVLAIAIVGLSLPLTIMKTAPGFFTAMQQDKTAAAENGFRPTVASKFENMSPAEAVSWSRKYYLWCGVYLLPALVLVRFLAARVYAGTVLDAVQSGIIVPEALHESEWKILHRLNFLNVRPPTPRHWLVGAFAWVATRAGAITVGFAMVFVWFGLVAQIYTSEFLLKTDRAQGWWNQPLIQIPYFNYIPGRLIEEANR